MSEAEDYLAITGLLLRKIMSILKLTSSSSAVSTVSSMISRALSVLANSFIALVRSGLLLSFVAYMSIEYSNISN